MPGQRQNDPLGVAICEAVAELWTQQDSKQGSTLNFGEGSYNELRTTGIAELRPGVFTQGQYAARVWIRDERSSIGGG